MWMQSWEQFFNEILDLADRGWRGTSDHAERAAEQRTHGAAPQPRDAEAVRSDDRLDDELGERGAA